MDAGRQVCTIASRFSRTTWSCKSLFSCCKVSIWLSYILAFLIWVSSEGADEAKGGDDEEGVARMVCLQRKLPIVFCISSTLVSRLVLVWWGRGSVSVGLDGSGRSDGVAVGGF